MSLKISTGLRNYLAAGGSLQRALHGCVCRIYSGIPPASADERIDDSSSVVCELSEHGDIFLPGPVDSPTHTPQWRTLTISPETDAAPFDVPALETALGYSVYHKDTESFAITAADNTNYDIYRWGSFVRYTSGAGATASDVAAGIIAAIAKAPGIFDLDAKWVETVPAGSYRLAFASRTECFKCGVTIRSWAGDEATDLGLAVKYDRALRGTKYIDPITLSWSLRAYPGAQAPGILQATGKGKINGRGAMSFYRIIKAATDGTFIADTAATSTTQARVQGVVGTAEFGISGASLIIGGTINPGSITEATLEVAITE